MESQSDLSELTLLLQLPSSFIVHLIQTLTRLFVCISLHGHIALGYLDKSHQQEERVSHIKDNFYPFVVRIVKNCWNIKGQIYSCGSSL